MLFILAQGKSSNQDHLHLFLNFKKIHIGEIFIPKFIKFLYKNTPFSYFEKHTNQEQ